MTEQLTDEQIAEQLARRLFDALHAQLRAEDDLFTVLESLLPADSWSDWSYDAYDSSLELYGCPPEVRLSPGAKTKLFAAGFDIVWLNHSDGWETQYIQDGREYRTDRGNKARVVENNAALRRALQQARRERDQLRESLIFANELLAHHNMQVCDKHPVSFKLDAYDRCPECALAPSLCRCAHSKHSHVINNLECEICGCPEYLPVGAAKASSR